MPSAMRTLVAAGLLVWLAGCDAQTRRISLAEYNDKVYASWLGQCIGNMYGLAHEFKYNDEPRTEPIMGWAQSSLERIREADGSFSDDDTDIEYVDLFCMEKYGPEPSYENLAEFWKLCINHHIWVANRSARDLMHQGYLPPLTGRKDLNRNWYQIDPQLVCEIWAVTAPGMLNYSAAKADWAAQVTNDDYGTHPTIWYNVMWSAAFFETDVQKLCQIGYEHLPADSIFRVAIDDVRQWKKEHGDDWVAVRKKIKEKYLKRQGLPDNIATSKVSALLNGTLGVLALLYGQGDFEKTMNIACMAGYDADNQCATLAGMVALMQGSKSIPRKYTHVLDGWQLPLNDFYKNRTRDNLPDGKITDMAQRTAKLGRQLVLSHGGRIEGTGDQAVMVIDPKATFVQPIEVRLFPVHLDIDEPAVVRPEIIGGTPGAHKSLALAGDMPFGMKFQHDKSGALIIAGTPTRTGEFHVTATVNDGVTHRTTELLLIVAKKNLARSAQKILAAVTQPTGSGSKDLEVLRDETEREAYDSYDGDNALEQDFYGYEWARAVRAGRMEVHLGPARPNGGWFETMKVQYRNDQGQWTNVEDLQSTPVFDAARARMGNFRFEVTFTPVTTQAVRIIGQPGGSAQFTSMVELAVYEK